MVHKEDRIVYGKIITQGQSYDLLDLAPQKHLWKALPESLRDRMEVFLVVDAYGTVKPLWISYWSGYVIIPCTPEVQEVTFIVEEGDTQEEKELATNYPME